MGKWRKLPGEKKVLWDERVGQCQCGVTVLLRRHVEGLAGGTGSKGPDAV